MRTVLASLLSLLICILLAVSTQAQVKASLKGSVYQNELIDNLESVGIKCSVEDGPGGKIIAEAVRMGSEAYYKGVADGDVIRGLVHKDGPWQLTIERQGKVYQLTLKAETPKRAADTDFKKELPASDADKSAAKPIEDFTQYDLEVVVDCSGSMNEVDGTDGLSKFRWCDEQVKQLAQRLAPYHKTLTITTFGTTYQTEQRCDASRLEAIFASKRPDGGTNLVDPLMSRLKFADQEWQKHKHRTLIAVITDGMPSVPANPHVVNQAIINFTQHMHDPSEVVVTILQIGDGFDGQEFCRQLDDELVSQGAKCDIVDTKTFSALKEEGLLNALIDAVLDKNAAHSGLSVHGQASREADDSLEKIKAERKEIEKRLLTH